MVKMCKHKEFSGTGVSEAGSLTEARWPQRLELAVARFAIQLLSKPLCQLCDKQKLNSRLDMPQNTEEQQARRRQRDVHIR